MYRGCEHPPTRINFEMRSFLLNLETLIRPSSEPLGRRQRTEQRSSVAEGRTMLFLIKRSRSAEMEIYTLARGWADAPFPAIWPNNPLWRG